MRSGSGRLSGSIRSLALGAAAIAAAWASTTAPADARCNPSGIFGPGTFNSGCFGQPVINGVSSGNGTLYTLVNINSDQFMQSNTGTALVWSAYGDQVLRKYMFLGGFPGADLFHLPNFGYNDQSLNVPALMGYNGMLADGVTPAWTMQFEMTVGVYGDYSYIPDATEPYVQFVPDNPNLVYGTGAAPGDRISATGIGNPGVANYQRVTVNTSVTGAAGSFDVQAAWAGVQPYFGTTVPNQGSKAWYKPPAGELQNQYNEYDQEFGLSKLPTVQATWGGSFQSFPTISANQCGAFGNTGETHSVDVCNTYGGSYTYMMLNGTGTRMCDPVQMTFYPDMVGAVEAANGIYCAGMQVNSYYPNGSPIPGNPPLTIQNSTDNQSGWSANGYTATGSVLPGTGAPNPASGGGPCVDITGSSTC